MTDGFQRFVLLQVTNREWLIQDQTYPGTDTRRTVACIEASADGGVLTTWLQPAPLPTWHADPRAVVKDLELWAPDGRLNARCPSRIDHPPDSRERHKRFARSRSADVMATQDEPDAGRRAVDDGALHAAADAAAPLREWRTVVDEAAAVFARAATVSRLPRTRVGLRRMWVVNFIPIKVPQHIDDADSFTAVGINTDGSWEPIDVIHTIGTGLTYRPGRVPTVSGGVPHYRIKVAFITHL